MTDTRLQLLRSKAESMMQNGHGGKELAEGILEMLDENMRLRELLTQAEKREPEER
jgi:hypothetical protein